MEELKNVFLVVFGLGTLLFLLYAGIDFKDKIYESGKQEGINETTILCKTVIKNTLIEAEISGLVIDGSKYQLVKMNGD